LEENRIPKRVLWIWEQQNWEVGQEINGKRRWENGRIVGGEGWQEKVHDREEWKKLLRTARNRRIMHAPMEWMNELLMTVWRFAFYSKANEITQC
jgi:hypothetical protein